MNWYLVIAAALAFFVGLVHSVLGERLIFRRLRQGGLVPTNGGNLLDERHVRILWASWHIVTVFGWFIEQAIIIATLTGSALVFIRTRARHPG